MYKELPIINKTRRNQSNKQTNPSKRIKEESSTFKRKSKDFCKHFKKSLMEHHHQEVKRRKKSASVENKFLQNAILQ